MAQRNVVHVLKYSPQPNKNLPLTSLVEVGEPLVNTADGKMYFKGFISGTGATSYVSSLLDPNYFEVGSHVSQIKVDDKIISYDGFEGATLEGKFLSGSSNGFEVVPFSALQLSIDSYTTGFTYSNNVLTIKQNLGKSDLSILLNTMTGLTVNGLLSATTANINSLTSTTANLTTSNVTTENVNTLNASGATITNLNLGQITSYSGLTDVSNKFLSGTTNGFVLAPISSIVGSDTYVTGFTFNPTTSVINLNQNGSSFSGLSLNIGSETNKSIVNLTAGTINLTGSTANSIIYLDSNKNLKTDSGFNYNETNNSLTLPTDSSLFVGSGGTVIGYGGDPNTPGVGDLTVHGNLKVFGNAISALTTELYVEDKNVIINYSPTNDTSSNSLGAGLTIQDGLGVSGVSNDVFLQIAQTNIPTNISTAYQYRYLESNLSNLMLGSSGGTGTGLYILKEMDILDGGTY